MPKDTFYNLDKEKKKKITDELIYEFSDKPFSQVNIKTIVENLGIARGSFYQYFNDLEDSYFYMWIKISVKKIHQYHILPEHYVQEMGNFWKDFLFPGTNSWVNAPEEHFWQEFYN